MSVARSLATRDGSSLSEGLELWRVYNERLAIKLLPTNQTCCGSISISRATRSGLGCETPAIGLGSPMKHRPRRATMMPSVITRQRNYPLEMSANSIMISDFARDNL